MVEELLSSPRFREGLVTSASVRALDALRGAVEAARLLGEGLVDDAARAVVEAWGRLTASIVLLDLERVVERVEGRWAKLVVVDEATWGFTPVNLKAVSQILEELGYTAYSAYTDKALNLLDYTRHSLDPGGELSKYATLREVERDIRILLDKILEVVEGTVKPRLEKHGAWTKLDELKLRELRRELSKLKAKQHSKRDTPGA